MRRTGNNHLPERIVTMSGGARRIGFAVVAASLAAALFAALAPASPAAAARPSPVRPSPVRPSPVRPSPVRPSPVRPKLTDNPVSRMAAEAATRRIGSLGTSTGVGSPGTELEFAL